MKNKVILYTAQNGAGSGKDFVSTLIDKALEVYYVDNKIPELSKTIEEAVEYTIENYKKAENQYKNKRGLGLFESDNLTAYVYTPIDYMRGPECFNTEKYEISYILLDLPEDGYPCIKITLADSLKYALQDLYPKVREYGNCLYNDNKDKIYLRLDTGELFESLSDVPEDLKQYIVTAEERFKQFTISVAKRYDAFDENIYIMNLRELMVYFGSYLINVGMSNALFTNTLLNETLKNINYFNHRYGEKEGRYIYVTDVRYDHEYNYIKAWATKNNWDVMTVNIYRDKENTRKVNNKAEQGMSVIKEHDYTFNNNYKVSDPEFKKQMIALCKMILA